MPIDLPYPGKGATWCVLCRKKIREGAMITGMGKGQGDGQDGHFAHHECYQEYREANRPPTRYVDEPGGPFGPPLTPHERKKAEALKAAKKAKNWKAPKAPAPKRKSVYELLRKPAI